MLGIGRNCQRNGIGDSGFHSQNSGLRRSPRSRSKCKPPLVKELILILSVIKFNAYAGTKDIHIV